MAKQYFVNLHVNTQPGDQSKLGFVCSHVKSGKPPAAMAIIIKMIEDGKIIPARTGDDMRANPDLGLYYLPVRIREVDPNAPKAPPKGGISIIRPDGSKVEDVPSASSKPADEEPSYEGWDDDDIPF